MKTKTDAGLQRLVDNRDSEKILALADASCWYGVPSQEVNADDLLKAGFDLCERSIGKTVWEVNLCYGEHWIAFFLGTLDEVKAKIKRISTK